MPYSNNTLLTYTYQLDALSRSAECVSSLDVAEYEKLEGCVLASPCACAADARPGGRVSITAPPALISGGAAGYGAPMTQLLDAAAYDPDDEVNLSGYADS